MSGSAISADSHIVEPRELFTELERRFGSRSPTVRWDEQRGDVVSAPGVAGDAGVGAAVPVGRLGIVGRRLERRHTPSRAGDVPHTLADLSKGKRLLGYEPLVDFDEGFRRTVEYFKGQA